MNKANTLHTIISLDPILKLLKKYFIPSIIFLTD